MKPFLYLCAAVFVTACTTPSIMLKHPKTGQVVTCGGNTSSSLMGGAIGYHMQESSDAKCEAAYVSQGFKRIP